MQIEGSQIERHNQEQLAAHQRKFQFLSQEVDNIDQIVEKVKYFQNDISSLALGTGGTRFGRFSCGGEPVSLEHKIVDIGLLHKLNQSSGAISLHIPWDIPQKPENIKALAASHGI